MILFAVAAVLAVAAVCTGGWLARELAEVCYPDLVCGRCGTILPAAGHECSERG